MVVTVKPMLLDAWVPLARAGLARLSILIVAAKTRHVAIRDLSFNRNR